MADLSRLPPQAVEVEQKVLGAMLQYPTAAPAVFELLKMGDFYRQAHNEIFDALQTLFERNEPIDLTLTANELRKNKKLEAVGGEVYLMELVEKAMTPANVEHHAHIVKEKASLRDLINTSTSIINRCYEEVDDVDGLLDESEAKIFSLSQGHVRSGLVPISALLSTTFEDIERYAKGTLQGIPSGFKDLDEKTGGFQNSDLIILAGRPSMGKTALALSMASYAGIHGAKAVAIFSLEMSKSQLVQRLLCAQARVNMHQLRLGRLPHKDIPKLALAAGPLNEAKIFIDDSSDLNILEIRSKARRLKSQGTLDFVIVDYLQLIHPSRRHDSREQEIAYISRSLKALAKDLNIPVMALSQLARRTEGREDKRPQLSDLRESGAIEQDADVVLFVYREEVYDKEQGEPGKAEIIIGKQRNGPIDTVNATFVKDYAAFENYSPRAEESIL
ncbi:MAG: replicative DNA helicase [Elusimicrobia bacterium RIFOXYB2_FULL_49_7]|nr:MAG: replicative DNA helicase [Elusimicrobia bacterium RIFOXYB2_FULL_49_7]